MHFSLIYVFLNTDFGRSGSGREFARKKSLRSKNRTELLTPAAILGFLCATYFFFFFFCISVSSLAKKLVQSSENKNVRRHFSLSYRATILVHQSRHTSSKVQLIHLLGGECLQKQAHYTCPYQARLKSKNAAGETS